MKRLLLLLAVLVPALGFAKIPDDEDILRKIMDSSSPFYYTNLMMRYENLDKLSEEEYHYLYYGYAYHENYKPTATNKAVEDLYASMIGLNADRPDSKQIEYIISVCNEAMMVDPFSPTVLNMLVFAYGSRGDKVREEAYFYHLQGILETIKSSGDGRTEKYPMHIIMFSHAVDVVSSMGVSAKRPEIISRSVEYIPLEEPRRVPDGKIRGFYFDYSRIYRNKPEDVTFKKKRTWQFNNLGPREYK
ncbi:MAG: DUF4919 domain-containing protein [Alistipes sp.]|nr:DUF4919 domain-containing protein [Alistipes sp.]